MSTKIYNGYKFKNNPSLLEVQQICHEIRGIVKPIANGLFHKKTIDEMVKAYDKNQFGIYDDSLYFLKDCKILNFGIERYLHKRIQVMNATMQRDPAVDFGFKISILPLKLRPEVLILLYTEKSELERAFESHPQIEEYHYQNNSDKPVKISNKLWEQRSKDWDDALGGDGYSTPQECGFLYEPYDDRNMDIIFATKEERADMDKYIPSVKSRAERIASSIMAIEWDEARPLPVISKKSSKSEKDERYKLGMARYREHEDFLRTDKGIAAKKIKIEVIASQLHELTFKQLYECKIELHSKIKKILKSKDSMPYFMREK